MALSNLTPPIIMTLVGVLMFSLPILYITWRSLSEMSKRRNGTGGTGIKTW